MMQKVRKQIIAGLGLVWLVLLVAGCGPGSGGVVGSPIGGGSIQPGSVSGRVQMTGVDLQAEDPMGLAVDIVGHAEWHATVGAGGAYHISGVNPGVYTVRLQRPVKAGVYYRISPGDGLYASVQVFPGIATLNVDFSIDGMPGTPNL